ncbi:MAG: alpha-ketoglutarate-dependent dioxygenase AlkB [Saprospiraceae bacterium]|nr:alpha-ketoglutarate-dependent dioxygenase AlkB [Saprospiraceae bacterium]
MSSILTDELPRLLKFDPDAFERLWNIHPETFHEIKIHGRMVKTPRWQQAFMIDYQYTGRVNKALPLPIMIQPVFEWVKTYIDSRLNGLLINWYDGSLNHYIGKHRDSTSNMIFGGPIVTISLGEKRIMRLRPYPKGDTKIDFEVNNGSILLIPYETNQVWTHEILKSTKNIGKRISLTFDVLNELYSKVRLKENSIESRFNFFGFYK